MISLNNWGISLDELDNTYYLIGVVAGNHKINMSNFMYSSPIKNIWLSDTEKYRIVIETTSDILYELDRRRIDLEQEIDTNSYIEENSTVVTKEELDRIINESIDEKDELKKLARNAYRNAEACALKNINNNELYIIVDNKIARKAIFKFDEQVYEVGIDYEIKTAADTVKIIDKENNRVDFRYIICEYIAPYHWSDGLEAIYIYNVDKKEAVFKGTVRMIECNPFEITKISKNEYTGEGLLEPDEVNGKSLIKCMLESLLINELQK